MIQKYTHFVKFICLTVVFTSMVSFTLFAQSPPNNLTLDEENHRMTLEGLNTSEFYNEENLESIYLEFEQTDYWQQLHDSYDTEDYVLGKLTYKGEVIDSIGAQFKGNTSYRRVDGDEKFSFGISLNEFVDGQDIEGYNTLNLNNAFQDPSFMKEVLYCNLNRRNIPAAKGNFIKLYINGEYWGIYANIQQLNKDFTKEWFMTNNGSLWRGNSDSASTPPTGGGGNPPGGGGGGKPKWGDGTTALNYLGADTALFQKYYTLKHSSQENPWDLLVKLTDVLNNSSDENLLNEISKYLDVDKTLWYLAHEIIFSDDDSYIMKGKQDYYIYYEPETQRFTPLEFDGNSAFGRKNIGWDIFYNAEKENFPLMNRLFAIPELRQRYLAHARAIIDELLDVNLTNSLINNYDDLIRSSVQSDTKNMNTFNQYLNVVKGLKTFFGERKDILMSNTELQAEELIISSVEQKTNDLLFTSPSENEPVNITATITGGKDVNKLHLYYSTYYVGSFAKTEMFDDGIHNDGSAGDGIYGGEIPGFASGEYVRYYVEAIANDDAKTASYSPVGAEHDVYYYRVAFNETSSSDVVINEICASNSTLVSDGEGDYDDWIELYNNSNEAKSLKGYYLSDDSDDLTRWTFPNITIEANSYLIIWADKDEEQGDYHAGFKLSASGEEVILSNQNKEIADHVSFGNQESDATFGRFPNGTGPFVEMASTFNSENNKGNSTSSSIIADKLDVRIYPNPANNFVVVKSEGGEQLLFSLYDLHGKIVFKKDILDAATVDLSGINKGLYIVSIEGTRSNYVTKLLIE